MNALTVCSLTIQYLYQDGENHIVENVKTGLRPGDIHWVLTVPAIWTDAAKQFMRKAATQVKYIRMQGFSFRNSRVQGASVTRVVKASRFITTRPSPLWFGLKSRER